MMNKIDMDGINWDGTRLPGHRASEGRDKEIAECLNGIVDYLENDFKKEIREMAEKEINNRFEILDL
jgi:hypothetical protein